MILAGDIGGTNTRLAYFEDHRGQPKPVAVEVYPSQGSDQLESIVERFLAIHRQPVDGACFGIAGPVRNGVCKTPNLPWTVDSRGLARLLDLEGVSLINDLEANAHGIAVLEADDLVVLNEGEGDPNGNAALISAGTGLGQAGLYRSGVGYLPFASEGGHADFAPRNELEIGLLRYLKKSHGHVSIERVLSGPGLVNIYRFLAETDGEDPPGWLDRQTEKMDPAAAIAQAAMAGQPGPSVRAMDLFVSLYGAEAGNLALKLLATGGLFVGGGIAPRILGKLKGPLFLDAFCAKGRMAALLKKIPVKVIVNDQTAMLGAARLALVGARPGSGPKTMTG